MTGRGKTEVKVAESRVLLRYTAYLDLTSHALGEWLSQRLLDRTTFKDPWAAKAGVFDFIEGFYNTKRIHSGLGYLSPVTADDRCRDEALTGPGALAP